jgi:hypothetical protein
MRINVDSMGSPGARRGRIKLIEAAPHITMIKTTMRLAR